MTRHEHGTAEYDRHQTRIINSLGVLCEPLQYSICWIEKSEILIDVFKFILKHEYYLQDDCGRPVFFIATLLKHLPRLQNEFNIQMSSNYAQEDLITEFSYWSSKFNSVFSTIPFSPLGI